MERDEPCAWLTKVGVSVRGNIKLMVPRTALNGRPRTTWNKGEKGESEGRMEKEEVLV